MPSAYTRHAPKRTAVGRLLVQMVGLQPTRGRAHCTHTQSNKTNWSMELSLISSSIYVICHPHMALFCSADTQQRRTEDDTYTGCGLYTVARHPDDGINYTYGLSILRLRASRCVCVSILCCCDWWKAHLALIIYGPYTHTQCIEIMLKLPGNLDRGKKEIIGSPHTERSNSVVASIIWKRDVYKFDMCERLGMGRVSHTRFVI